MCNDISLSTCKIAGLEHKTQVVFLPQVLHHLNSLGFILQRQIIHGHVSCSHIAVPPLRESRKISQQKISLVICISIESSLRVLSFKKVCCQINHSQWIIIMQKCANNFRGWKGSVIWSIIEAVIEGSFMSTLSIPTKRQNGSKWKYAHFESCLMDNSWFIVLCIVF